MDSLDRIDGEMGSICLIVDDVRACRLQLNKWLTGLGYRCIEAESALTALELIPKVHPELIVTDIDMPGISGLELLQAVRAHGAEEICHVPVVVISSLEDEAVPATVARCNANAFLAKPLEKQCFVNVVKAIHPVSHSAANRGEEADVAGNRFSNRFRSILERIFQKHTCSLP